MLSLKDHLYIYPNCTNKGYTSLQLYETASTRDSHVYDKAYQITCT